MRVMYWVIDREYNCSVTEFDNNIIEIPLYIAHSRGIRLEKIMYVRELKIWQFTFCDILERDVLEWLAGLGLFRMDMIMKEVMTVQVVRVTKWNKITHTLPFKSISAANEKEYQHPLEKAYVNLHEHDQPVNVVNSNWSRLWKWSWTHVGYIASELNLQVFAPTNCYGKCLECLYVQLIK